MFSSNEHIEDAVDADDFFAREDADDAAVRVLQEMLGDFGSDALSTWSDAYHGYVRPVATQIPIVNAFVPVADTVHSFVDPKKQDQPQAPSTPSSPTASLPGTPSKQPQSPAQSSPQLVQKDPGQVHQEIMKQSGKKNWVPWAIGGGVVVGLGGITALIIKLIRR